MVEACSACLYPTNKGGDARWKLGRIVHPVGFFVRIRVSNRVLSRHLQTKIWDKIFARKCCGTDFSELSQKLLLMEALLVGQQNMSCNTLPCSTSMRCVLVGHLWNDYEFI